MVELDEAKRAMENAASGFRSESHVLTMSAAAITVVEDGMKVSDGALQQSCLNIGAKRLNRLKVVVKYPEDRQAINPKMFPSTGSKMKWKAIHDIAWYHNKATTVLNGINPDIVFGASDIPGSLRKMNFDEMRDTLHDYFKNLQSFIAKERKIPIDCEAWREKT